MSASRPRPHRLAWLLLTPLLVAPAAALLAHDPSAAAQAAPQPDWDFELGLSYLATTGNSETSSGGVNAQYTKDWQPWSVEAAAFFLRAEDSGDTTAERYGASVAGSRALGEGWSLTAGWRGERDLFSGNDARSILDAGVKWKAVAGDRWAFDVSGSLSWTYEDLGQGKGSNDYLGALVGVRSKWQLSENAGAFVKMIYFPNFDDGNDYRLEGDAGLRANLSSRWAMQLSYGLRYDNQPVPGFEKTDTATTASLVVKLPAGGS